MTRLSAHELARLGEDHAEKYFLSQKYRILERNYRCPFGEIDLIVEKKGLVFVEVKTRRSQRYGSPEEAVTSQKQMKIAQSAQYYLAESRRPEGEIRFDVLAIEVSGDGSTVQNRHFPGAFEWSAG